MKPKPLFEIGSALDNDEGWAQVVDKESLHVKEMKAPAQHQLVFKREKRRGKPVIITGPFHLEKTDLQTLLKRIKKKMGTGGTAKEEWLEFQGECQEKLRATLETEGFRFKK